LRAPWKATVEKGITSGQPTCLMKHPPSLLTRRTGAASMAMMLGLSCGCANDQQRTRAEGAGVGAVVGGLLGAAIGGRDGAAVGAVVGAAGGAVYGDQQAKKKQGLADREDALKLAAARSEQATREARTANEALQRDVAALEESVKRLKTQNMDAGRRAAMAKATQRRMQQALSRVDGQLASVRDEIARQQQVLQRDSELARQAPPELPASLRLVRAGVDDLRSQERALEQVKAQLALLDASRAY
jgi:Glycine zipper